jgi:hypothetical protein
MTEQIRDGVPRFYYDRLCSSFVCTNASCRTKDNAAEESRRMLMQRRSKRTRWDREFKKRIRYRVGAYTVVWAYEHKVKKDGITREQGGKERKDSLSLDTLHCLFIPVQFQPISSATLRPERFSWYFLLCDGSGVATQ